MENKRRDFLKLAGLTGIGLAAAGLNKAYASDNMPFEEPNLPLYIKNKGQTHEQRFNMSGFAAPKISTVRVGIIGLGQRGPSHVQRMSMLEGVEIRALCDLLPEKAEAAKKKLARMTVRYVEITSPVERYLFEVYAAIRLNTHKYNTFETH